MAILNEQLRIPLETLRQRLQFDDMTGVYKPQYFVRSVEDELEKRPDAVLSVGIVELSGLRDLVDTLPLISLQSMLQGATKILRNELRGNDIIGRWNDTAFAVMLPNTPGAAARGIFERIVQALTNLVEVDHLGTTVKFDPHIGGAESNNRNTTPQALLEKCNVALDHARRSTDGPIFI